MIEGLGEIIHRSGFQGGYRGFRLVSRGEDEAGEVGILPARPAEQFETIPVGQLKIDEHCRELFPIEGRRLVKGGTDHRIEVVLDREMAEKFRGDEIVVDNQQLVLS